MTVAVRRTLNDVAQPGQLSPKRPAAGYLRSETQLEGDSLRKQLEAVVRYARDHSMQLIRIYCDECSSGLRIDGRPGLHHMFRDIESGTNDFVSVLLLDPRRWSRSLNPDHGLFLEDRCEKFGIQVHYCADGLEDDETPEFAIFKSLKRYMAKEYERELAPRRRGAAGATARIDAAQQGGNCPSRPEQGGGGQ